MNLTILTFLGSLIAIIFTQPTFIHAQESISISNLEVNEMIPGTLRFSWEMDCDLNCGDHAVKLQFSSSETLPEGVPSQILVEHEHSHQFYELHFPPTSEMMPTIELCVSKIRDNEDDHEEIATCLNFELPYPKLPSVNNITQSISNNGDKLMVWDYDCDPCNEYANEVNVIYTIFYKDNINLRDMGNYDEQGEIRGFANAISFVENEDSNSLNKWAQFCVQLIGNPEIARYHNSDPFCLNIIDEPSTSIPRKEPSKLNWIYSIRPTVVLTSIFHLADFYHTYQVIRNDIMDYDIQPPTRQTDHDLGRDNEIEDINNEEEEEPLLRGERARPVTSDQSGCSI